MKKLLLRNTCLDASQGPRICVSLTSATQAELDVELSALLSSPVDILEWRLDFFEGLGDSQKVLKAAEHIRGLARERPVLLTRRSYREGGQAINIGEEQVLKHYQELAHAQLVDMLDWELDSPDGMFTRAVDLAHQTSVKILASYHNFQITPDTATLIHKLTRASELGADIAKIAVMPNSRSDVLRLLEACVTADDTLEIPVVGMAMAPLGAVTRLIGAQFGSAMTFAAGRQASAPGQWPIHELDAALQLLQAHS